MCLSPIRIPNPSRRFVAGVSAPYLYVPCRKCSECRKREQDDWFVRAYMEFLRVKRAGGDVWFPTLTFNDEHLPWYVDDDHGFSCQCCDVDLIKRFRDHFRVLLQRAVPNQDIKEIRFEFVTEYGGERGRIHHHALIFVPFHVDARVMVSCLERAWSYRLEPVYEDYVLKRGPRKGETVRRHKKVHGVEVLKKVPKNGFVMWSKKGMKINDSRGIRYVQKYITKPARWIKEYGIEEYEARLKRDIVELCDMSVDYGCFRADLRDRAYQRECNIWRYQRDNILSHLDLFHCEDMLRRIAKYIPHTLRFNRIDAEPADLHERIDRALEKLRYWRSVKPRHLQSTSFGLDGVDYFKNEDGSWNLDSLEDGRISLADPRFGQFRFVDPKHPNFLYHMPTYYANKIFKTKDAFGLMVCNDVFDAVYAPRYRRAVSLLESGFAPYFGTFEDFALHLSPLSLSDEQLRRSYDDLQALLSGRSVRDLAMFQLVYDARVMSAALGYLRDVVSDDVFERYKGIRLWRVLALPYLYLQKHPEKLRPDPDPERSKNWWRYTYTDDKVADWSYYQRAHSLDEEAIEELSLENLFRPSDLPLESFSDLPEFNGFDYIIDTVRDFENDLSYLKNSAAEYWDEKSDQIAQLCGLKDRIFA